MRVLLWHGWLLEGSGSNVYTARSAQTLRRLGHDVLLLCQEVRPELVPYVDAYGTVDADGVQLDASGPGESAQGRVTLLRPEIGPILPVFVWDEYEGFHVRRFVDLDDADLERLGIARYLDASVFSSEVRVRKPDPRIFREALERVGTGPDETVFVGDRLYDDIGGAQAVGMRAVQTRQFRAEDDPSPRPDAVIGHLAELPPILRTWA